MNYNEFMQRINIIAVLTVALTITVLGLTFFSAGYVSASHCEYPYRDCLSECLARAPQVLNDEGFVVDSSAYDACFARCAAEVDAAGQRSTECYAQEAAENAAAEIERQKQTQGESNPQETAEPKPVLKHKNYVVGEDAQNGEIVKTGKGERATLRFPDDSHVELAENTTFKIGGVDDREVTLELITGRLASFVERLFERSFKIRSATAVTSVRGTSFVMESTPKGTEVQVLQGTVDVSDINQKKTVQVTAGGVVLVPKGGIPSDPVSFDPQKLDLWFEPPDLKESTPWPSIVVGLFFAALFIYVIVILGGLVIKLILAYRREGKNKDDLKAATRQLGVKALKKIGLAAVILILALGISFYFKLLPEFRGSTIEQTTDKQAAEPAAVEKVLLKFKFLGYGSGSLSVKGDAECKDTDCFVYSALRGSELTITATPKKGSVFAGWLGACSGMGACKLTMNSNKSVSVIFSTGVSTLLNAKPYVNAKEGFLIHPPRDWVVDESGNSGVVAFLNTVSDKDAGASNGFQASIRISTEATQNNLDVYFGEGRAEVLKSAQMVEEGSIETNGEIRARTIGVTFLLQEVKMRSKILIMAQNGKGYAVTAMALESAWDKHKEIIDRSLQTFALTDGQ